MTDQPSAASNPNPPVDFSSPLAASGGTSRRVVVSVKDVIREYRVGGEVVRALNGVSLDIFAGEYLSIMGPSGSGKSTLFNMIGGLDTPTSGTVTVHGVKVAILTRVEQSRLRNRALGFIFQSYNLIPVMTAQQNVALPMLLGGMDVPAANEKAAELLAAVGLGARLHHRPEELSGGQQQRVAIARSFANDPAIILADEPTGNLDTRTGEAIIDRLSRLSHERGVTIISATHDHKMLAVSDRVVTISDGKIAKIELRKDLQIRVGTISTGDEGKAQSATGSAGTSQKAEDAAARKQEADAMAAASARRTEAPLPHGDALVQELRQGWAGLPTKTLLSLAMGGLRVRMMRSAVTMLSVVLAIAFLAYTGLSNRLAANLARAVVDLESFSPSDPGAVAASAEKAAAFDFQGPLDESHRRELALKLGLGDITAPQNELVGIPDVLLQARNHLTDAEAEKKRIDADPHSLPVDKEGALDALAKARANKAAVETRQINLTTDVAYGRWLHSGQVDQAMDGDALQKSYVARLNEELSGRCSELLEGLRTPDRFDAQNLDRVEMLLKMEELGGPAASIQQLQNVLSQERSKRNAAELRTLLREAGINAQVTLRGNPMDTWLIIMALLTCAVGIANAMLMSVTERFREIGTMKCLGATDSLVVKLFLLESAFLGVIGACIGIVLGILVALLAALLQFQSYGLTNFPLAGAAWVILLSLLGGVGLSIAGAVYPAYSASRMRPVDALRVEE